MRSGGDPDRREARVKSTYTGVMRWVRFHARLSWVELEVVNAHWVRPLARLFLAEARGAVVGAGPMALLEEAAAVVWRLEIEHSILSERVKEMHGPAAQAPVDEASEARLRSAPQGLDALTAVARSVDARHDAIISHAKEVDGHTRLVLARHAECLARQVKPSLEAIIERVRSDDVLQGELGLGAAKTERKAASIDYDAFAPNAPRAHRDTFLPVST